jgi:hypothetical protein
MPHDAHALAQAFRADRFAGNAVREPRVHCGQHREQVVVSQLSGFGRLDASTAVIVVFHAEI